MPKMKTTSIGKTTEQKDVWMQSVWNQKIRLGNLMIHLSQRKPSLQNLSFWSLRTRSSASIRTARTSEAGASLLLYLPRGSTSLRAGPWWETTVSHTLFGWAEYKESRRCTSMKYHRNIIFSKYQMLPKYIFFRNIRSFRSIWNIMETVWKLQLDTTFLSVRKKHTLYFCKW